MHTSANQLDHKYLSADPADSPRVQRPTMPPPCFQRPWRSISWVGAGQPVAATRRRLSGDWPARDTAGRESATGWS